MALWKPGQVRPGVGLRETDRGNAESSEGLAFVFNRSQKLPLPEQRKRLPVFKKRREFLYLLENNQVVIVVGETGSGKTTQLPQYAFESGWAEGGKCIACTQPRRIAATMMAQRVAEEVGCELGTTVGYAVRFDDTSSVEHTRIRYLTDGVLFREILSDPLLLRYNVVMIDEVHERSLFTDLVLALLRMILKKRSNFRVIVSSATLESCEYLSFFGSKSCQMMMVEGRMFPVTVRFLREPCANFVDAAAEAVISICRDDRPGDILVFLPGQDEIEELIEKLESGIRRGDVLPLPFYANLPVPDQLRVFQRSHGRDVRKIICSTNIAESSVTIDGVVFVIDCGFVKQKIGDALLVTPISKASAIQRSGRAGRVSAGFAYRLFTEESFRSMPSNTIPEMLRSGTLTVASVILDLKAMGIHDPFSLRMLCYPRRDTIVEALSLLHAMGGIDDSGKITPIGYTLSNMSLNPMMGRMLLASIEMDCVDEILTVSAMLSVDRVFVSARGSHGAADISRRKFAVLQGDSIAFLNIFREYQRQPNKHRKKEWCLQHHIHPPSMDRVNDIRKHMRSSLMRHWPSHIPKPIGREETELSATTETIQRCIARGYFAHAARQRVDGSYELFHPGFVARHVREASPMYLHPSSVVSRSPPKYLVFHDVQETSKRFMMDVTAIDPSWLDEFAASYFHDAASREAISFGEEGSSVDSIGGVDVDMAGGSRLTRKMKFS